MSYIITGIIVFFAVFGIIVLNDRSVDQTDAPAPTKKPDAVVTAIPEESRNLAGTYEVGVITSTEDLVWLKNSLTLAAETINSGRGIMGKKLVFGILEVDASNASAAISSSTSKTVITTHSGIALASLAGKGGIIALSTAGPDQGSSAPDNLFNLGSGDDLGGSAAAAGRYAVVDLKGKRIAAISGTDSLSVAVRRKFGEAVRRAGGFLVDEEVGTVSTGTGVSRIKSSRPDVVFVYSPDDALRSELAMAIVGESSVKLLTVGDTDGDPKGMPNGALIFSPIFDASGERTVDFVRTYSARFGSAPEDIERAAVANAIPYLIRDLIDKDGDDTVKMRKTLGSMIAGWSGGAIGSLSIDRDGNAVWGRYEVKEVRDGKSETLGVVRA